MMHNKFSIVRINRKPLIIGASIGNCVHIAGVANFLRFAEAMGFQTVLLGAAISPEDIIAAINEMNPEFVGISYRLTPDTGKKIIHKFLHLLDDREVTLFFGGTPRMVEVARGTGRFKYCFIGDEPLAEIDRVLRGIKVEIDGICEAPLRKDSLPILDRLDNATTSGNNSFATPLIRAHFGLPCLEETIQGIEKIAEAQVLDVISIAPDQNAQQFFFRPHLMNAEFDGAGGVPLRKEEDLDRIWKAGHKGNYPLFRIYSGTQDLLKWAEMSVQRLHNAWGAVPLFWYSELDGRSKRTLKEALAENRSVIKWYAKNNLPVEVLESHQWSLRDAPDPVATATAYLGAYNAKHLGVKNFIAQYMFNNPRFTSPLHDLVKMTTKLALIESLRSENFIPWRQVRSGLSHFSIDADMAKGQLASSILNALGLRPHILHVVSFSEADHAATAEDIIESCKIVQGVLKNAMLGLPDPLKDERITIGRRKLLEETSWVLGTIFNIGKRLGVEEPFLDQEILRIAVQSGVLDAPHLSGQPCAVGTVRTIPWEGGCYAYDADRRKVIPERDRLLKVLKGRPAKKLLGSAVHRLIGQLTLPDLEPTRLIDIKK